MFGHNDSPAFLPMPQTIYSVHPSLDKARASYTLKSAWPRTQQPSLVCDILPWFQSLSQFLLGKRYRKTPLKPTLHYKVQPLPVNTCDTLDKLQIER